MYFTFLNVIILNATLVLIVRFIAVGVVLSFLLLLPYAGHASPFPRVEG